ncbi:copper resistance protein B [Sphingomonas sp. AX6]|uniref:copper resistance protein B n=1 Tax=Sphingomonas sp. AX6 TaxID=2653171 RepID=UPI0012EFCFE0|nr:copper resistance protein B [Sphingomonas sp. AX6]VXC61655.1 Copper resistance protein B [Sphingomonas sp. AX6]
MNRLLFLGAAMGELVTATPALAQSHGGHSQHGAAPAPPPAPTPSPTPALTTSACTPEHAEMGHCEMPAPPAASQQTGCTPEHAEMGHCKMPEASTPESAAQDPDCLPEHAEMGHCTSGTGAADADGEADGTDLSPGDAPAPRPVVANYADRVWGQSAMQPARDMLRREHGGGSFSQVMIDLAEVKIANGHAGYKFEADAWFGGDINRLVLKADGEGEFGEPFADVELKALYSRAIGPYFNLPAGVRQDLGVGPDRTHAAIGVEGLAPYWFEVDGYLYLSTQGEVRASASAEYDQRLTQRLTLQPKVEFELSAQDIPELGIGSGLTSAEIGLRLRYEIAREFAPYVGIVHEAKFGCTADFARAAGDDPSSTNLVVGIRAWF